MEQTILALLTAQFPGVGEVILRRTINKIVKTAKTEDDAKAAVEALTIEDIINSYADSRVTEATNTAISNYEKKHNIKDGVKIEDSKQKQASKDVEPEDQQDDKLKAALDAIKALSDKIDTLEQSKIATSRLDKLKDVIKDAPEQFRNRISEDFNRMSFKDDEDFNSWIGNVQKDSETLTNDERGKGALFTPPAGGRGKGDQLPAELQAAIKERAESQPSKQALY